MTPGEDRTTEGGSCLVIVDMIIPAAEWPPTDVVRRGVRTAGIG